MLSSRVGLGQKEWVGLSRRNLNRNFVYLTNADVTLVWGMDLLPSVEAV